MTLVDSASDFNHIRVPLIVLGAKSDQLFFFRSNARTLPASGRLKEFVPNVFPISRRAPNEITESETARHSTDESADHSYPFPVWSGLLVPKHRKSIGIALWFFLWLLDRVTREEDGWGIVLGGRPVKDEEVALKLGLHINTVRSDRATLFAGKYIECTRTPYGFTYKVRNSRKFGIWGEKRPTKSCGSQNRDPQKPVVPDQQIT